MDSLLVIAIITALAIIICAYMFYIDKLITERDDYKSQLEEIQHQFNHLKKMYAIKNPPNISDGYGGDKSIHN
jgi:Tfp pilus assembly protein PilO